MAEQRNVIWPKRNQDNAESIRAALDIPKIERGPGGWKSKVVSAALTDWAHEIEVNPNALDAQTVRAYSDLYNTEVYVNRPWDNEKPTKFNVTFTPDVERNVNIIGQRLEQLHMPNATGKGGYNSTAIVMIALDKYAKKLELTKGMENES